MNRIAVLTSGGDAPGMNAAIRAVVRTAVGYGWQAFGVLQGYKGLIEGSFRHLGPRDVSGIVQLGGTMLGSARCPEFQEEHARERAIHALKEQKIDALVVIGGNGSQSGAAALNAQGFPVVGIASTIDNDLVGTEICIGVDTALNVALEAIDRLKTTAKSHHRAFLVEVMGRECGYLALMSAIAGGAEAAVIPESPTHPDQVAEVIRQAYKRGKTHAVIVVAEGAEYNAQRIQAHFAGHYHEMGFEIRTTILGHVQRGGAPGAYDRILATRLAAAATEQLHQGNHGVLLGLQQGAYVPTAYEQVAGKIKSPDPALFHLANVLAQ